MGTVAVHLVNRVDGDEVGMVECGDGQRFTIEAPDDFVTAKALPRD
jgi:hypothetical protein